MKLKNLFPAVSWIKNYKSGNFYFDLLSSVNLSVSMLPKAMAYSLVAGLPPIYGLYASFVAPLIAILFGSNRILFTGPVGVMTVLVFTSLQPLAEPFSQEWISLAALLSLLVGIVILLIAVLRLTYLLNVISHAAILGFVNAAALIIVATQLKYVFGVHIESPEYIYGYFFRMLEALPETNILVLALSLVAIAGITLIHKFKPSYPDILIILVPMTLLVYFSGLGIVDNAGNSAGVVQVVGILPQGFPTLSFPDEGWGLLATLVPAAIIIAIVAMTETYSISKIVAQNTKQKVDYDQEFRGQGLANIATSFFMGYPVCGSFSGTTVNWISGARTGLSIIIFSFVAVLAITVLTPLFTYLPKFMLAVIVIVAVIKLFKPKQLLEVYRINKYDGAVALVTFGVSLILKPDDGIIVGVALALVLYVWKTMHTSIHQVVKDRDTGYFISYPVRAPKPESEKLPMDGGEPGYFGVTGCKQTIILKPEGPLVYINAEHMRDEILGIVRSNGNARHLILDMAAVYYLDVSGVEAIKDLLEELDYHNIKPHMIHLEEEARESLAKAGLIESFEVHETKKEAISSALRSTDSAVCKECSSKLFVECEKTGGKVNEYFTDSVPSL